jgi:hypothetical protein
MSAEDNIKTIDIIIDEMSDKSDTDNIDTDNTIKTPKIVPKPKPDVKKKPGRPKKVNINPNIKIEGICKTGFIERSVMELIYYNPAPLKKVMSFFKSMNVRDLTFKFLKTKTIIITTDHLNKSDIIVEIDGNKMLRYYCKEEFSITIDPENMKKVFHLVDKECEKLIFYSLEDSKFSKFNVMIDCLQELGTESEHSINLVNTAEKNAKKYPDIQKYPLILTLPSKTWKKYINNIHLLSDEFAIQHEVKKNDTSIRYTAINQKITSKVRLYNGQKDISIQYTGKQGDTLFLVGVRCEYCKPLSSILISDFIIIRSSETDKINFEANINNGECVINVFTEIIPETKNFGRQ